MAAAKITVEQTGDDFTITTGRSIYRFRIGETYTNRYHPQWRVKLLGFVDGHPRFIQLGGTRSNNTPRIGQVHGFLSGYGRGVPRKLPRPKASGLKTLDPVDVKSMTAAVDAFTDVVTRLMAKQDETNRLLAEMVASLRPRVAA
jgi:hypothetical protein